MQLGDAQIEDEIDTASEDEHGDGARAANDGSAIEVQASIAPVQPIVRRGQTVRQFMDDSKKAELHGLGV